MEQGVITLEQALAVQAEYDRRRAAEQAPAAVAPKPCEAIPPAVTPVLPEQVAAAPAEEKRSDKWYDRFDFKGDLRLRAEFFKIDGLSVNDRRERFRARFRAGMHTNITDWMDVGFQLRSGDPDDPVSDNSTFDGGFALIPISISEAYAGFRPNGWLDLTFGKFDANKKWVVSDMQWDDDVTVAGAMEEFSFGPLKFDLYQYLLEEDKATRDAYLLGGQLYGEFGSDAIGNFKIGAGFDDWVRPQMVADLTLSDKLQGNRVTNLLNDDLQLISDFEIANIFATWSWAKNPRWPVKVSAFGYLNTGAQGLGKEYDTGYFLRLQVGDYKKKYQMMFRATRYYSEPTPSSTFLPSPTRSTHLTWTATALTSGWASSKSHTSTSPGTTPNRSTACSRPWTVCRWTTLFCFNYDRMRSGQASTRRRPCFPGRPRGSRCGRRG